MVSLNDYLKNPCGTLSIPYWKNKNITIPSNLRIVHDSEFYEDLLLKYSDEMYFRLVHTLQNVKNIILDDYAIKTASTDDIPVIVDLINDSYADLSVSREQILEYAKHEVYDENLWVIVYDKKNSIPVGCGIAEFDIETSEGILEWIQVLPEYRGKKIGQQIVNELLRRLRGKAKFVTVSGKVNNPSRAELLYRKCGFEGNDVWHIMLEK